jgi:hypothetical protein
MVNRSASVKKRLIQSKIDPKLYKGFEGFCDNLAQPRTRADVGRRRKFEAQEQLRTWVIL